MCNYDLDSKIPESKASFDFNTKMWMYHGSFSIADRDQHELTHEDFRVL